MKMIQNLFNVITEKKFLPIAITLSFAIDLITSIYVYYEMVDFKRFKDLFTLMTSIQGISAALISPEFIDYQYQLVSKLILMMLAGFIAIHSFVYLFAYLKKVFAIKYMKIVSTTGAILAALMLFTINDPSLLFVFILILIIISYIFISLGISFYKLNKFKLQ